MNRVVAEIYTGFSALTVSASCFPFTGLFGATVRQQPSIAIVTFEGSAMRYSVAQGFTATSGSGHLVFSGDSVVLRGEDVVRAFNVVPTAPTGFAMASVGYL